MQILNNNNRSPKTSSTKSNIDTGRIPPGQYLTDDFPVLSVSLTPEISAADWRLKVFGGTQELEFDLNEIKNLGTEEYMVDIHCVTKWSKLDTVWKGVSFDKFIELAQPEPTTTHILAHSYDSYTTNIPLDDLKDGKAFVAYEYAGKPIEPKHGGPVRLIVPHLYFWKSAKWLKGLEFLQEESPGFWEQNGYHNYGDPWREQRYDTD